MHLIQFLILLFTNISLLIWIRYENNSNFKRINEKLECSLKEIDKEMKDFHGKLYLLEKKCVISSKHNENRSFSLHKHDFKEAS